MKRVLSILLCVSLLIGCLATAISAADDSVNFIVATDLHYIPTPKQTYVRFPGEKYYCADKEATLTSESCAIIRQFLRESEATDASFMLLCGDLTNWGTYNSHVGMAQLLRDFAERSGKKVFVINGNHDFYGNVSVSDFRDLYHDFGYDQALEIDEATCSYTADLTDDLRLLALDTCSNQYVQDSITPELLDWAQRQAETAKKDGKQLVCIMHHNFLEHIPLQSKLMSEFIIDPAKDMKTHLINWGVRYVFTGHSHMHDIKAYTNTSGKTVYDILTTSLSGYPCAYRTAKLTSEGLDVKTKYLQGVRQEDLPQSGYTQELLDELTGDLQTFADGCFRLAFNVKKDDFVGEESLRRRLSGFGGEKLQRALDVIYPSLFANMNLPIYTKDAEDGKSLQSIAEGLGLNLPQTDDRDIFDTLYFFATTVFCGDENVPYNDERIVLFTQCIYSALYASLCDVSESEREAVLSDLSEGAGPDLSVTAARVGSIALKGMGNDAMLETALLLASPFIEMYSKDSDDTPDGDAFLPNADDTPIASFLNTILHYLRLVWTILKRYVVDGFAIWTRKAVR